MRNHDRGLRQIALRPLLAGTLVAFCCMPFSAAAQEPSATTTDPSSTLAGSTWNPPGNTANKTDAASSDGQDTYWNPQPKADQQSGGSGLVNERRDISGPSNTIAQTQGGGRSLTADQILSILQEQPDALVEVKAMAADLARQQGALTQPENITDQMLYAKIDTSPALRSSISTFLYARGYVSREDFSSDEPDNVGQNDEYEAQTSRRATSLEPGQGRSGNPEGAASYSANELRSSADEARRSRGSNTAQDFPRKTRTAEKQTSDPPLLHRPTPYNMLSLRDLYTQVPQPSGKLKRFGSDFFTQRTNSSPGEVLAGTRSAPLDVPAGPGYVVGPGDSLKIDLWGGISQSFTRTIDREGRLALPEAGTVQVAGLTLERVQNVIGVALKQEFRDLKIAVTLDHLRSIRIFVVGDVQRPGSYDISSLASSLNALYAAGGPTGTGSLRTLRHIRGKQLIGEIDLYDFLLHGMQAEDRLLAGDTLLVPPAGPQVAVYGSVRRPAIYEIKGETSLATLLEDAGGTTASAQVSQIVIDRIGANQQRETISIHQAGTETADRVPGELSAFTVRDGDTVRVSPILPYSQRVVYVEGHVARPGRMAYREGMRLSDILHSYQDLLPEPADEAEIVRLVAPDLHPETLQFHVADVLIGNSNIALQPLDTIRVHGRYEADSPQVMIKGEVLRPGTYPLSAGMTSAQLVRMAGGFKRDALLENADLTSYRIGDGTKVVSERTSVAIGDAVQRTQPGADVVLKPGDVLTIHQISGWSDIGSSITIEGEVSHPGSYGIQQGERLSSILRRAGGLREASYPDGAVLLRTDVRRLEEQSREELIRQIETTSVAARVGTNLASNDQTSTLQLLEQQQQQVLSRLRSQPVNGRLVIHISGELSSWENTPDDIEVRAGDVLRIPKRPGFVLVNGQVYNSSAITFSPGKTAEWYLRRAGGATEVANKKDIFIIRANGSVVGRGSGSWLGHEVLSTRLDAGDVVVVPQKIIGASMAWRNLLTVAQVASSVAITAAVAGLL
jgi:protein involved in polysaccharide export with SLBB domain